jgi:hypothetical protein
MESMALAPICSKGIIMVGGDQAVGIGDATVGFRTAVDGHQGDVALLQALGLQQIVDDIGLAVERGPGRP